MLMEQKKGIDITTITEMEVNKEVVDTRNITVSRAGHNRHTRAQD